MLLKFPALLAILSFLSSHALPVQQPGVHVKQVIAVESITVDAHGNRIGVHQSVVDVELLKAHNNDLKSTMEAQAGLQRLQVENGNGEYVPAAVDLKSVPSVQLSGATAAQQWSVDYARRNGLHHVYQVQAPSSSVLKSVLSAIPKADVKAVQSVEALQKAASIDYLLVPSGLTHKSDYVLASMQAFNKRALVHFEGCSVDSVECKVAVEALKAAGWQIAFADNDEVVVTRGNPKDTRSVLEQTLDSVFAGLMAPNDKRYVTMRRVAELAILRGSKVFVETGTARNGAANCGGDGCSTVLFGRLMELIASLNPKSAPLLYTVDINPQAIKESRLAASAVSSRISYHAVDSVKFLDAFAQPIDIFYLDSYDFNGSDPQPSQRHHLKELVIAWSNLHANTVIIVDDCGLSDMGKCKLVDEHLMYAGWRLDTAGYQRVYVKQ